jgi:hypothetical protein
VPLMTGLSIPHPPARTPCAGEEIVHSRRKLRGRVNPLVVGSNPTGPTESVFLFHHIVANLSPPR